MLTVPDLLERLRGLLGTYASLHLVLVVGGGTAADLVRDLDRRLGLGTAEAHWLAVEAMSRNAQELSASLQEIPYIRSWKKLLERIGTPGASVYDPAEFLREVEPGIAGTKLEMSWSVTSDSIAGRVAIALEARALVLLKSCDLIESESATSSLADWVRLGQVDPFMERLARELPSVHAINLRDARWWPGTRPGP